MAVEKSIGICYNIQMMLRFLHRLLLVVTAFAFLGGATLQAMPVADAQVQTSGASMAMAAGMPCEHMDTMKGAGAPLQPCKGMTPDCIKQMGCIGFPDLPQAGVLATPVAYVVMDYRQLRQTSVGLFRKPDLDPPIAI
ncbi:MAG TPA: hypothetical protein VHO91_14295 [Rhodopila sp.]|nr:hypothetical protein [Rhodopila sp.]